MVKPTLLRIFGFFLFSLRNKQRKLLNQNLTPTFVKISIT